MYNRLEAFYCYLFALTSFTFDITKCYTTAGMELARVTLIDCQTEGILIDELVFPRYPVVDLNTRFSGIKSLERCRWTLDEARQEVWRYVKARTVLVGHGLVSVFVVHVGIQTR